MPGHWTKNQPSSKKQRCMTVVDEYVAIVGLGTMGSGIAQLMAQHGIEVMAYDVNPEAFRVGLENIRSGKYGLDAAVAAGKLARDQVESVISRIKTAESLDEALRDATFVVENVPEDLTLKQQVFRELDAKCDRSVILATDTSGLSITAIGAKSRGKERIIGMHFFIPPQVMKLVEVIRGKKTSVEAVSRTKELAKAVGKTPVTVVDSPGFTVARLGLLQFCEACKLVEQGVISIEDTDLAVKLGLGHPMGPFELTDLIGLDTRLKILEGMYETTRDLRWKPPRLLRRVVDAGYLGDRRLKKGSRGGFYDYIKDQTKKVEMAD